MKGPQVVEESHVEILEGKGILGSDNPKQLLRLFFFICCVRSQPTPPTSNIKIIKRNSLYVENDNNNNNNNNNNNQTSSWHETEARGVKGDNPSDPHQCIVHLYTKYMHIERRPPGMEDCCLMPLQSLLGKARGIKGLLLELTSCQTSRSRCSKRLEFLAISTTTASIGQHAVSFVMAGLDGGFVKEKTGYISESDLVYLDLNRKVEIDMSDSIIVVLRHPDL